MIICSDDYTGYSNITITGNMLENINGEEPPIHLRGSGHVIENNSISNCDRAILISDEVGDPVTIRNNHIINNSGNGVRLMRSAILRGNTIENNEIGVLIQFSASDLGQDNELEAGNNTIRNNTDFNVDNGSSSIISAYRNYWGLTDANDIDATISDDDEDVSRGAVNFDPFLMEDPNTSVEQTDTENIIPLKIELYPAYPNPFNPETQITYHLSKRADVTLKVVDITGRTIQNLISAKNQTVGSYTALWNGTTERGNPVPSGMYLMMLDAGPISKTQKVILLK